MSITQRVMTVFGVNTAGALGGLDRLSRAARTTRLAIRGVHGALSGISGIVGRLMSPATLLAGGGLIGGAIYGLKELIGFKAELETTHLAFTQVIQDAFDSQGAFGNWTKTMQISQQVLDDLRAQAVNTPASFDDLKASFIQIVEPLTKAGASLREVDKLSAAIATRELLTPGSPQGALARDVRQLLTGYASAAQIGSGRLRGIVNEMNKLVRAGKLGQAVDLVTKKLAISEDAAKAFGDSFSGKLATLKDQAKEFLEVFGSPVFDWVKEKMTEWSKYLKENKTSVMELAREWGGKLLTGMQSVAETMGKIAGFIVDVIDGIKRIPDSLAYPAQVLQAAMTGKPLPPPPGFRAPYVAKAGSNAFYRGREIGWAVGKESPLDRYGRAIDRRVEQVRGVSADLGRIGGALGSMFDSIALDARRNPDDKRELPTNLDFRGSTFRIENRISSDDPSRILSVSLLSAGQAIVQRPLSARFGLGSVSLANGGG